MAFRGMRGWLNFFMLEMMVRSHFIFFFSLLRSCFSFLFLYFFLL